MWVNVCSFFLSTYQSDEAALADRCFLFGFAFDSLIMLAAKKKATAWIVATAITAFSDDGATEEPSISFGILPFEFSLLNSPLDPTHAW